MSGDNEIKRLAEVTVAFVPSDAKGLLFVKLTGEWWTQKQLDFLSRYFRDMRSKGAIACETLVLCVSNGDDIALQHLSDDQLREIGFQRISPDETKNSDITAITRSFA